VYDGNDTAADIGDAAHRQLARRDRMDRAHLDHLHDMGQLQTDAPFTSADQEKSGFRPAHDSLRRASSADILPAIAPTGST
jgi:hypothetical protein